jgi:hypothetical protein
VRAVIADFRRNPEIENCLNSHLWMPPLMQVVFRAILTCERMQSSVRPVYATFQMPLAGMEIRGSVPHHIGGLIIPV